MLASYKQFIAGVNNSEIEFILDKWTEKDNILYGLFSTGKCHNTAVIKAKGDWILKMDLDCYCDYEMFDNILFMTQYHDYTWFANFGCKNYIADIGFPQGNQYLCSKKAYLEVDGEPEFTGYGHEDYALLYKLYRLMCPDQKLEYNEENVSDVIRDKLARPLNKLYQDVFFYHRDHERQPKEMLSMWKINKKKLYEICREIDNDRYNNSK